MMLLQTSPDPTMVNDFMSTITASTLAVSVIQWLKDTKYIPFINQHSATLNRFLSWAIAFFSGAGIHYTFNGDAGVLTVTGLSAGVIIHTATITCKQYAAQWLIYKGIVKGPAADVTAVKEGMPVTPVAPVGSVKAGIDAANETPKGV
jgi:hypothetical protein